VSRILLGVTGGIAAYKALELVRLADAAGHSLRVVQTPTSRRFVGAASFEALTGAPVLVDEFEHDPTRGAFPDQQAPAHQPLSHLELVSNAELYLIAPASANTIAKLAHGLADNLLTSAALACRCPLLVAPAMNDRMYVHPATQANLELLRARGASIVGPSAGELASKGERGVGRLLEPDQLLDACERVLHSSSSLSGLRVLVTAGGTREPIDAVRFVGNRSSGRMGLALAEAAERRGAEVALIVANVSLPCPSGVRNREVSTAAELQQACEQEFPDCDVLLMAAAVADFRPAAAASGKLKKVAHERLSLELEPTPDVLSSLATHRHPEQTLVGFAAEHGRRALELAHSKLEQKGLDVLVANDVSQAETGFEAPDNEVLILTRAGETRLSRAPKSEIAEGILDVVEQTRAASEATVRSDARPTRGRRLRALPARF
jgi:phosphopantothenoylcysteine decarboxylase/phosphopantothenate--cysteine ligase